MNTLGYIVNEHLHKKNEKRQKEITKVLKKIAKEIRI